MNIPDKLFDEVMSVLIHQVGDIRGCPKCGELIIIEDRTSHDAHDVYKKLQQLKDNQ